MFEFAVIFDWLEFAVRWLHVVAAMAWIGSSFYFIALDLGLRKVLNLPKGAAGEEWQVHGGGFYHINKYLVAPEAMPEHLTWFKWESYSTWLSGAALLAIVYWAGSELYLIDANKLALSQFQAILLSAASLTIGWLVYNQLCKSKLSEQPTLLMVLLFFLLIAMAYGYNQIFTGRASLIHLGAFTATIMTANVFFIIMPNQRIVVADLKAGRAPDPKYGKIAKLRSTHNNYLTLPVIFLMLSTHYPLAFASPYNWLIAGLVFLMGVTIRHYFNTKHARRAAPNWTWLVTAIIFIFIIWLSARPIVPSVAGDDVSALGARAEQLAASEDMAHVEQIVMGRCSMCHAAEPSWPGMIVPPKGIVFESRNDILRTAKAIYLQAGRTTAMPPANLSFIEDEERAVLRRWYNEVN